MKNGQATSRYFSTERLQQVTETLLIQAAQCHEPAVYHLQTGGSRLRMRACLDACQALHISQDDAVALAASIELLHNASLIHDDLQDNDKKRRGHSTVWSKYGVNIAICSGDFLLTKAFAVLASHGKSLPLAEIITEIQQAVSDTIVGQCDDVSSTETVTPKRYETIAVAKSGPLIALPLVLPLIASGLHSFIPIAKQAIQHFAVSYQITDDIGDWQSDALSGHLNLVNVYRKTVGQQQALALAKQRALYLIKRCEKELLSLPSNCAVGIVEAACDMLKQLKQFDDAK